MGADLEEISDGLIAAIEDSDQAANVIVEQGAAPGYDVIVKTANAEDPTVTVSANLSDTTSAGEAIINSGRTRLLGFILDADLTAALTIKDGTDTKLALTPGTVKGGVSITLNSLFLTDLRFILEGENDSGAVMWIGDPA